ncbi:hypothetical protein RJ641_005018 [Dillenia turbinata]|uniref:Uncharacterized protein n=1 Tax=Dillenia turbinata TaxID=194707 RepID=A0AAN8VJH0_9MAGN
MSLVDYASSDDEGEEREDRKQDERDELRESPKRNSPLPPPPRTQQASLPCNRITMSSSKQQPEKSTTMSVPSPEKLPDASLLLNSPTISSQVGGTYDHYSRVATAKAENASQKRELNRVDSLRHSKVPRGMLPHSRNVPDTVGDLLLPPQLKGRSNVVTEDLGKLFVKNHANRSSN